MLFLKKWLRHVIRLSRNSEMAWMGSIAELWIECAVLLGGGEQLLEAVDDEVGFQVVELRDPRITEVTSQVRCSP